MFKNCCSSRMVFVWTIVVLLLFGGSLLLAFWGIPLIIKGQIHSQTQLIEDTEQWDRFVELPFPLDYSIRFFNVTNPDDVLYGGLQPILQETEPFNYKLTLKKENVRFEDANEDSVTFTRSFGFEFDYSGTTSDTDEVTTINPLLMAALQMASTLERLAIAGCLDRIMGPAGLDKVFITKPVRELLFEGVTWGWANASDLGVACEIVRQRIIEKTQPVRVIEHLNQTDPDYLILAMFNYKTPRYVKEPPDGIYTINRGIDSMEDLGTILRWNGGTNIPTYGTLRSTNNETCQKVRGTDSTIYKPNIESGEELIIYNTDICRTVALEYQETDEEYNGIKAFRYEPSEKLFKPTTVLADDDCYCTKATLDFTGNENCYLDGLFDFRPCLGAPALVSQPHFLGADVKYLNAVQGLSPDKSKHGIYLLLEPNTGTPLNAMKRIQINSVLKKQPLISFITPETMYEGVFPLLWLEEGVSLPQEYVDLLNDQYFKQVSIATGLKYGLIALFAALLAVCLFMVWRKEYLKNKRN